MTDTAIITMPAAGAPAAEAAATDSVPHLRAFMLALDPTDEQKVALAQHFGASRWAFNHAHALKDASRQAWRDAVDELTAGGLDEKLARKQVKTVLPTKATIQKRLNELKGDDRKGIDGLAPWWHTVSTYAFQSAFADADLAWSNWMSSLGGRRVGKPVGYPRFKKRDACRDSVRIHHDVNKPTIRPDGYRRIIVPRIGSLRLHESSKRLQRFMKRRGAVITQVTLSRAGKRYYASLLVRCDPIQGAAPTRRQAAAGTVGIDVGISRLATLSTGLDQSFDNLRHLAKSSRRLKRAQQDLSRTQKGSTRREKAKLRVAAISHLTAVRRTSALHQVSKSLVTGYAVIAIEDLQITKMTKSARGTVEKPGSKVRQKSGLNRAMLDAALGTLRSQLAYKAPWYGSAVRTCNPAGTSKNCSGCGTAKAKLSLSERTYCCDNCGLVIDRDLNAAINIRQRVVETVSSATNVARDKQETQNARGGSASPPRRGRQHPLNREDQTKVVRSPCRSDSAALQSSA